MKKLDNYILEKLKIGKSTLNKDTEIKIEFDYSDDFHSEKLDMMFSSDDLENIIDFAENLEIQPTKISNKFHNTTYSRYVLLYYKFESNRIIIKRLQYVLYKITIVVNGYTEYEHIAKTLSKAIELIEKGIKTCNFFNIL